MAGFGGFCERPEAGVLGVEAFSELDLPREPILTITGAAAFRYEHA